MQPQPREPDIHPNRDRHSYHLRYVLLITWVAAVGGLLFGYDTAVIAGAIGFLQQHFDLNETMKGWAASCALIGCIFGALLAGPVGDKFGRKKAMVLCAILFTVSAIGSALPRTLSQFVVARFIGGLGVGAASLLCPLYIAEISPAAVRGRLVSLNQLTIVIGIFVVYFVNLLIQQSGDEAWNVVTGWRWMFGSETLPAIMFLALLAFVPESPRWLAKQNRDTESLRVLARVTNQTHAEWQLREIRAAIAHEGGSVLQLFQPRLRITLIVSVALAVFQQFTGINAIMYYAPEVFKAAGTGTNTAFIQTVSVGAVNVAFTLVAIWLIDRVGRKPLLLGGTFVQAVALAFVGFSYARHTHGPWVLVFVLLYVAAFGASMGAVVWVIIAEIFPTRIRGRAMSIATVALWAACYVVSQTYPMLVKAVGDATTFWIYGAMSLLCFFFTLAVVPETKGQTLEEIEASFLGSGLPAASGE
jgi:SP family arabinose:H+ symporter-like MFS transporter